MRCVSPDPSYTIRTYANLEHKLSIRANKPAPLVGEPFIARCAVRSRAIHCPSCQKVPQYFWFHYKTFGHLQRFSDVWGYSAKGSLHPIEITTGSRPVEHIQNLGFCLIFLNFITDTCPTSLYFIRCKFAKDFWIFVFWNNFLPACHCKVL